MPTKKSTVVSAASKPRPTTVAAEKKFFRGVASGWMRERGGRWAVLTAAEEAFVPTGQPLRLAKVVDQVEERSREIPYVRFVPRNRKEARDQGII